MRKENFIGRRTRSAVQDLGDGAGADVLERFLGVKGCLNLDRRLASLIGQRDAADLQFQLA